MNSWTGSQAFTRLRRALRGNDVTMDEGGVSFESPDALVHVVPLEGGARIGILAELPYDTPRRVRNWQQAQPNPRGGVHELVEHSMREAAPCLFFERAMAQVSWGKDPLVEDIRVFSAAWLQGRDVPASAMTGTAGMPPPNDPRDLLPSSAWLLMGDADSLPSSQELANDRHDADIGVFSNLWTCAKQTLTGDLLLFYFLAPHKQVRYLARAASDAFFASDIEVNAKSPVAPTQHWCYITPLIEIEPIPYRVLQSACDGHLVLRGRSGRFLRPEVVEQLAIAPADAKRESELGRVLQKPAGIAELPDPATIRFDTWKRIAPGALPLEAHVTSHIVEPMLRFVLRASHTWVREHRCAAGLVDVLVGRSGVPTAAIEVKLTTPWPAGGNWSASADVQQLLRYMNQLATPGALIDASKVLLFDLGADDPAVIINRREATNADLAIIGRHLRGR